VGAGGGRGLGGLGDVEVLAVRAVVPLSVEDAARGAEPPRWRPRAGRSRIRGALLRGLPDREFRGAAAARLPDGIAGRVARPERAARSRDSGVPSLPIGGVSDATPRYSTPPRPAPKVSGPRDGARSRRDRGRGRESRG